VGHRQSTTIANIFYAKLSARTHGCAPGKIMTPMIAAIATHGWDLPFANAASRRWPTLELAKRGSAVASVSAQKSGTHCA
jgi:hypothetical protein